MSIKTEQRKVTCRICGRVLPVLGLGKHLKNEEHSFLTTIQYAEKFHTEEWVRCSYCGDFYFRRLADQHSGLCCCKNKKCKNKHRLDVGRIIGRNVERNKKIGIKTKEWTREHKREFIETCKKGVETRRKNGSYDFKLMSKRAKKGEKTKRENGYYESETHYDNVRVWREQGVVDRLKNPDKYKKIEEEKRQRYFEKHGVNHPWKIKEFHELGNSQEAIVKRHKTKLKNGSYKSASIKRHETMKRNGTYGTSKSEDFMYQLCCRKLPLDWSIVRQHSIPFYRTDEQRNDTLNVDLYIKELDAIILIDSYWHGLGRPLNEVAQFKTNRDVNIYKTMLKDIQFNEWATRHNVIVLRFDDIDIRNLKNTSDGFVIPFFSSGSSEVRQLITQKLNDDKHDLFSTTQ